MSQVLRRSAAEDGDSAAPRLQMFFYWKIEFFIILDLKLPIVLFLIVFKRIS